MLLLLVRQESAEHAKFRALAQILVNKEKSEEVFKEYIQEAFPYLKGIENRRSEEMRQLMEREMKRGPLRVSADLQQMYDQKRRTLKKLTEPQLGPMTPEQRENSNRLYSKMASKSRRES